MYPILDKVYKRRFPFRLGTTSYIYPDGYAANVRTLGPFVDEIELLIFESGPDGSFPGAREIREMADMAADFDLSFNLHLPLDIFLGDPEAGQRQRAVDIINRIMALTEPLNVTTSTLHLPYTATSDDDDTIRAWQGHLRDGLSRLFAAGINPRDISIETLNYPIGRVEDIIATYGLSVCLDVGHLIVYDFDLEDAYRRFQEKTPIIHLHGVSRGRDHLPLDRLSQNNRRKVISILKTFGGCVSIEVFAFDHLARSVAFLEKTLGP